MPKLRIRKNNRWEDFRVDGEQFTIGREADNNLVIESFFISRHHCEIRKDDEGFAILDLGSKVGVQVNDQPVSGTIKLRSGDRITFANKFEALFLDTVEQTVTTTLVTQDADETLTGAVLTGIDGPTTGEVFGLDKNLNRIGRNPTCDIHIKADTVSQGHAEIVREKRDFILVDLGSVNGTFINNIRIHRQTLKPGDLVRFDWISFRFDSLESLKNNARLNKQGPVDIDAGNATIADQDMTEDISEEDATLPYQADEQSNLQQSPSKKRADQSGIWMILLVLFLITFGTVAMIAAYWLWTFLTTGGL